MGKSSTSGQGRIKGVPNKATAAAREAIALFVDGNAPRLQGWLDEIAKGIPKVDQFSGVQLQTAEGELRWLVPPNPEKAFQLFQSVVEYHVPKLARIENEHSGVITLADALNELPPPK